MNVSVEMKAEDTVSGSLAECWVIKDGKRYNFFQAIKLEARFEKIRGDGGKIIGWKGTGNVTFHYNDSIFREMMIQSKETGEDIYFDMLVTNDDPASHMGRQTVLIKDYCIESGTLTEFDAEGEYLVEDMDFIFGDFEVLEKFRYIDGEMKVRVK